MRITLSITNPDAEDQDLLSLEIFPEMTFGTLRDSIQAETNIPHTAQHLYHNGRLVTDVEKTMEQLQIGDGEMLALHVREMRPSVGAAQQQQQQQQQQQPPPRRARAEGGGGGLDDPELIRLQLLGDPQLRAETERKFPWMVGSLDNAEEFARRVRANADADQRARAERHRVIAQLNADPFDVDAQARIEEIIRQERVMENLQNAMEHNPEVFGRVHLLYVDVEVNGHKLKALVDSGAQATIMSPASAEACGIMRLVDKRFAGIARGVGTANIIGRVHSAQIKLGNLFLPCSFTVMEGKTVDLLLGLDMLKRHQACIDLNKDKLIIQGEEIPFLGEADVPKDAEEVLEAEPTVPGPGGTTIGQKTGVVSAPAEAAAAPPTRQAGPSSAPGAPTSARSAAPAPSQTRPNFPPESIEQLMALGFSQEDAINALAATGGNVEYAASMLFQG